MRKPRQIELIKMPPHVLAKARAVAHLRTAPLVHGWARSGTESLNDLAATLYLQGIADGYEIRDRAANCPPADLDDMDPRFMTDALIYDRG